MAWPISLISVSTATCGNLLWTMQGARYATLIVKATFQLLHEQPAALTNALEVVPRDRAHGGSETDEAGELAPYLPGVSVLLRGHACTPDAKAMTALRLRLGLYKDQWLLNKMAYVYGDRGRNDTAPSPFSRLPLVWERAYGGPSIEANPKGVGAIPGGNVLPNIVDATVPTHPVGFGPIPGKWPSRARFLHGHAAPDLQEPELGKGFDFRYFHPAPPDQQLPAFPHQAWIYLEGMHPQYPWIRSALPTVKAQARIYRMASSGVDAGTPVALSADTLVIHADDLLCSILWRGNFPLAPDDAPERLLMVAGLELPGQPIPWPSADTLKIAARGAAQSPADATKALGDLEHFQSKQRQLAPFAIAAPSSNAPASPAADTPWGAPTARIAIPPSPSFDRTIAAPPPAIPSASKPDVGGQTIDARSLGARHEGPALPFQYTPPDKMGAPAERASTGAPSAMPFGQGPLPPPPAPSAELGASTMIAGPRPVLPPLNIPPAPPPPLLVDTPEPEPITPPRILEPPLETPAEKPEKPEEAQGLPAIIAAKLLRKESLGNLALSGQHLAGIDFSAAILDHISFAKSTLSGCNFDGASLIGADFSGAELSEASFVGANLQQADLCNTTLNRAHFEKAKLKEAKLAFSKAEGVNFDGASLEAADLKTARWLDSTLIGADLSKCTANKADFSRSRLDGAKLDEALLRAAKLKQAILAGASLDGTDLRDADLSMANVFECKLESAKTAGAVQRGLDSGPPPKIPEK